MPLGRRMSSTARHSSSRLRDGAFDGAPVYRDRVFLTGPAGAVVGGVRMFQGRISTVDSVGRTQATVTVASDLVILDYDMPRNLFSPTCLHVLYDAGCGIIRGTFSLDGAVGAGSNSNTINFSGARAGDAQGSLVFTSGANANVRATVKSVSCPDEPLTISCIRCHSRRRRATFQRRIRLRSHASDLSGQVQQPRQLPRLPLRAAAATGLLRDAMKAERFFEGVTTALTDGAELRLGGSRRRGHAANDF